MPICKLAIKEANEVRQASQAQPARLFVLHYTLDICRPQALSAKVKPRVLYLLCGLKDLSAFQGYNKIPGG